MHKLSRQCCAALCQAGIAQPLVSLLTSESDGHRYTEVCASVQTLACFHIIYVRCVPVHHLLYATGHCAACSGLFKDEDMDQRTIAVYRGPCITNTCTWCSLQWPSFMKARKLNSLIVSRCGSMSDQLVAGEHRCWI